MKLKIFSPFFILAVFFADRLTKTAVLSNLLTRSEHFFGFLTLRYVENTGVAFGMLSGSNSFFIVFTIILIAAIVIFRRRISANNDIVYLALSLILGGALGNLYDRILFGHVIDFIDFKFFPAVFNIADSCVTIGAFMIFFFAGKSKFKKGESQ